MKNRTALRKTAVRLAAALTIVAMSAACSSNSGGSGGKVKNPNVITMVIGEDPDSLDPAAIDDRGMGRAVLLHGYDRLLEVDPRGSNLIPSVASEVPTLENGGISKDGLTYTFKIRDDVTFQDGSKMTADDVVYSWDRVMKMNLPEGQAAAFEPIDTMDAPDDTTFVVKLKDVDASFLNNVVVTMPASIVNSDVVEKNGGVQADKPTTTWRRTWLAAGRTP